VALWILALSAHRRPRLLDRGIPARRSGDPCGPPPRGADAVTEILVGHRPALWVSDLYGAQQGHAGRWQVCLAHQLLSCKYAIDVGDNVFAPRIKALLLRRAADSASPQSGREHVA